MELKEMDLFIEFQEDLFRVAQKHGLYLKGVKLEEMAIDVRTSFFRLALRLWKFDIIELDGMPE